MPGAVSHIEVERRRFGDVPALLVAPHHRDGPLPVAFWFHGLGADKDVHLPELERLGAEGFLAIGIDAVGHGERRLPDLDERIAGPRDAVLEMMLDQVMTTAGEIHGVITAVVDAGIGDRDRISAVGISMGGYLVYHAIVVEPMIRTVVALLGSPTWPTGDSPDRHPRAFAPIALLSITAELDASVPPDAARRFHRSLARTHPDPNRLKYVELAGADHLMDDDSWRSAMAHTTKWLLAHNAPR
jgi:dienelactone hydrolase